MTDDDPGAPGGAPPKLTIGQRILTALPTLQRPPAPAPRTAPATRPGRPPRSPRLRGRRCPAGRKGASRGDDDSDGATDDADDDAVDARATDTEDSADAGRRRRHGVGEAG